MHGARKGKLADVLLYDPAATQKVVARVDHSRRAFPAALAEHILVRPLKSYFQALKNMTHIDRFTGCLNRHAACGLLREDTPTGNGFCRQERRQRHDSPPP